MTDDRKLMSLSAELEALLATWIDMKRRIDERHAAINAAVQKEMGISAEDRVKYQVQSIRLAMGGEVSPDVKRYGVVRRRIEERFPEIEEGEWERATAPLEIIIDEILSIRPETFAGLGVHARAMQYIFENPDHPSDEDCSKLRQFLADTMRLAGLPGPMVPSNDLDAATVAFTKSFADRFVTKIEKYDDDWFEANKRWDPRDRCRWAGGMSDSYDMDKRRKWAEEARREANSEPFVLELKPQLRLVTDQRDKNR